MNQSWTFLENIWNFFDGKKTIIGGFLLGLAGMWWGTVEVIKNTSSWVDMVPALLSLYGGALISGGGFHKYLKVTGGKG